MRVITVARKPLDEGSITQNVLTHGTGAINVDGCRIGTGTVKQATAGRRTVEAGKGWGISRGGCTYEKGTGAEFSTEGRWPANVILQGDEVAAALDSCEAGHSFNALGTFGTARSKNWDVYQAWGETDSGRVSAFGDVGGASRFFKKVT